MTHVSQGVEGFMTQDPYAKSAKKYDRLIEPFNRVLRRIAFDMAPVEQGARVLDVGCGTGSHLLLYIEHECKAHGIEQSPAMFEQASQKLGDSAELQNGDATAMPYPDDSFDLVIVMLVLHEIDAQTRIKILAESKRVMKKNGRMLVIDYHPERKKTLKGFLKNKLIRFVEYKAGKEHFKNYKDFIARDGLFPLLKQNALSIQKQKLVTGGNIVIYVATDSAE